MHVHKHILMSLHTSISKDWNPHMFSVLQVKTNLIQSFLHLQKKPSETSNSENCSQSEEYKP